MNVTIVCQGFEAHSIILQPWKRIYELSKRMKRNGISVTIVTDETSNSLGGEGIDGIDIVRISALTLAPFINRRRLVDTIRKSGPDIVVWCGTLFSAAYISRLKSLTCPFVWDIDTALHDLRILFRVSIRELFHPHHKFLLGPLLTAVLPRFMMRSAANSGFVSGIVVPSRYLKDSLIQIGVDPGKITVIPSTIETKGSDYLDDEHAREGLRRKLGFTGSQFIVTYYGSPCSLRGPDTAIRSLRTILQKNREVRLIILSRREKTSSPTDRDSESEEEYLRSLAKKLGLENHVDIIAGVLNRQVLVEYLKASDAIVLPFKIIFSEPPLSVLETMRLGKTVVSTNLEALNEIMRGDRGIMVRPNNPEHLAGAILFLTEHPEEAREYGKKALEYAKNLPDWNNVADQLICLLNELHDERRSKLN